MLWVAPTSLESLVTRLWNVDLAGADMVSSHEILRLNAFAGHLLRGVSPFDFCCRPLALLQSSGTAGLFGPSLKTRRRGGADLVIHEEGDPFRIGSWLR